MTTDLNEGSPAGRLYGESLSNALAAYLLGRYTAHRYAPVTNKGGPSRSIIEAGLDAGFQNPSHFARVFRKFVGISPSRFQSEMQIKGRDAS
jgi:AraC-like DNA-binding protein